MPEARELLQILKIDEFLIHLILGSVKTVVPLALFELIAFIPWVKTQGYKNDRASGTNVCKS